jgi:hypothetical protein
MQFNPQVQRILNDIKSQPVADYNMNTFNRLPQIYNDPISVNENYSHENVKRGGSDKKFFDSFSESPRIISSQTYERPLQFTEIQPKNENNYIRYVPAKEFQNQRVYAPPNSFHTESSFPPANSLTNGPSFPIVYSSTSMPTYNPNPSSYSGHYSNQIPPAVTAEKNNSSPNNSQEVIGVKLPERNTIILERGDQKRSGWCC